MVQPLSEQALEPHCLDLPLNRPCDPGATGLTSVPQFAYLLGEVVRESMPYCYGVD